MLFDEKVVALVERQFVAVITDHPRGGTEPKRNPEIWERCEGWKPSRNGSDIVWLVSADASRRAGLVYGDVKEPEQLLAWMDAILVFDGRVEKPSDRQVQRAVEVELRERLRSIWRWTGEGDPDRTFYVHRKEFRDAIDAVSGDELCAPAEARALLDALRLPAADRRDALRATLNELLAAARGDVTDETPWLRRVATWHDADRLGGVADHEALVRFVRAWVGRAWREGRIELSPDVASALGLVRTGGGDRDR